MSRPSGLSRRQWLLWAAAGLPVGAKAGQTPAERRWKSDLDAFADADQLWPPPAGCLLFIGSSTIRMWNGLEWAFPAVPQVVKRGFGGGRLADCADLVPRLVLPYEPRQVVLYAGDNDLSEGASPQAVAGHCARFVQQTRTGLPGVPIAFVSVKPSPSRLGILPAVRETNALLRQWATQTPGFEVIDVFTPMVDAGGLPRRELFLPDMLHLNAAGYALWQSVISPHLRTT